MVSDACRWRPISIAPLSYLPAGYGDKNIAGSCQFVNHSKPVWFIYLCNKKEHIFLLAFCAHMFTFTIVPMFFLPNSYFPHYAPSCFLSLPALCIVITAYIPTSLFSNSLFHLDQPTCIYLITSTSLPGVLLLTICPLPFCHYRCENLDQ